VSNRTFGQLIMAHRARLAPRPAARGRAASSAAVLRPACGVQRWPPLARWRGWGGAPGGTGWALGGCVRVKRGFGISYTLSRGALGAPQAP